MANYRIPSDYKNDAPRSVHHWRSPVSGTFHPGLAYPVKWRHLDAGDRVRCKPEFLVQSQPMLGPLLQGFKLVTIATFTPDAVLYGWLSSGVRYNVSQLKGFSHLVFNPCMSSGTIDATQLAPTPVAGGITYRMGIGLGPSGMAGLRYDTDKVGTGTTTDYQYHVGRGSLWEWLGVPAGATHPILKTQSSSTPFGLSEAFDWRVEPAISYFLSVYYYLANMQEESMYYTSGSYSADFGEGYLPFEKVFRGFNPSLALQALASVRANTTVPTNNRYFLRESFGSQGSMNGFAGLLYSGVRAHGGLFSVPYDPDFFTNIIKLGESPTAYIPVIEDSATGDKVAVPQVRLQSKIQSWMDRLFVSGGRFGDVLRTLWGTKSNPYFDKPEFLGIWQSSINPSNVIATSNGEADGESVNVGQMAARIDKWSDFGNHRGVDFTSDVPGTLLFITFLVPGPAYCQGLDPGLYGSSFADDFNPELNGMGFLSVARHRYSLLPEGNSENNPAYSSTSEGVTVDPNLVAVGDSVAFDYYKTDYPRLHGEFTTFGVFSYWTLQRRFTEYMNTTKMGPAMSTSSGSDNFSTYINPLDWQYLFAAQSFFDPNFILFANIDITVVNKVQSSFMPYLK